MKKQVIALTAIFGSQNSNLMKLFFIFFALAATFEVAAQEFAKLSPQELTKMEEKLILMVNQVRLDYGLSPLRRSETLSDCARHHSEDMASYSIPFGHSGFRKRALQMQKIFHLKSFGENVAYTYCVKDPLQASIIHWMKSPGHRKNILGDYEKTGIGIRFNTHGRCYLTQLFGI